MATQKTRRDAVGRFARLAAEDVPRILSPRQAWFLSGGVLGSQDDDTGGDVPLSLVCLKVADCEAFLDDFRGSITGNV